MGTYDFALLGMADDGTDLALRVYDVNTFAILDVPHSHRLV